MMAGKESQISVEERKFGEKCAVFGIINPLDPESSRTTAQGLLVLQHRGQKSSGITSSDGEKIFEHRRSGLVSQVYDDKDSDFSFSELPGHISIGHNRYGTSSRGTSKHLQPVVDSDKKVTFALNGNDPDTDELETFLDSKGIDTSLLNDAEMQHATLLYFINQGATLEEATEQSIPHFKGAFSFLAMDEQNIVAARDTRGIRPLSIGAINGGGWVFSSETCAIDTIGAKYVRDVDPGEIVVANEKGLFSRPYSKDSQQKLDIFEFVYFSRPDSILLGQSVYEVRKRFGAELAKEFKIDADMVIPIPESSVPAALGYSRSTGIPMEAALVKNKYIGRTFISDDDHQRDLDIAMKYNPIPSVLRGKRAVVIDDSIVRGKTSIRLIRLLREAGLKELYMLIPSPPVKYPDFYGIDTPTQEELIAFNKNVDNVARLIGADKLFFLSVEGMIRATKLPKSRLSTSCFTGEYPIDIGKRKAEVVFNQD